MLLKAIPGIVPPETFTKIEARNLNISEKVH